MNVPHGDTIRYNDGAAAFHRTGDFREAVDVALGYVHEPYIISRRAMIELLKEVIRRGGIIGVPDREYRDILADLEGSC